MFRLSCAVRLIVSVFVLLVYVQTEQVTDEPSSLYTAAVSLNLTVLNSTCWDNDECKVAADLTRGREYFNFKFKALLNCHPTEVNHNQQLPLSQYLQIPIVALDGCNVNRQNTLGVEFVPDPSAVRTLSLRMFRIVGAIPAYAFVGYGKLESLDVSDSIIDEVSNSSLSGLYALKTLTLSNSGLRKVDDTAFVNVTQLKTLIIREPWLHLGQSLELPDVTKLVVEVASLYWCFRLPESLEEVSVFNTQVYVSTGSVDILSNMSRLKTFNLVATNATEWSIIQSNTLLTLNVSHNHLDTLANHNLPTLHTYDISGNKIHTITEFHTKSMRKLKFLFAQNNRLEAIAPNAFMQNSYLQMVDLTGNQLRHFNPNLPAQQDVLIQVDNNEWNCRWADELSISNPQIFARFRYVKVLDSLNTRGLRCKFYEQSNSQQHGGKYPTKYAHNPTSIPILVRRPNPKDTAMLTLTILVVGVAILFLMLFLHIKCRRDGLPQFNRFLPPDSMLLHHQMADRTDFVRRKLPPTEYEDPIVCLRSTPPAYDVEKRKTDEGFVYEEIAERKNSFRSSGEADDSSPVDEAIKVPPLKVLQKSTLYDQFQISYTPSCVENV